MTQVQAPNPAEVYESFFVPVLFEAWTSELLRYAGPRSGERVLDVACGTGIVARRVAQRVGSSGNIVGLDISPAMQEVARARAAAEGLTIDWREGNAVDLPFPDGAFALLLCQQGLQFFPDRPKAVREMRRVLADGGRAAIAVWRGLDFHPLQRALSEAAERHLGIPFTAPFSLGDRDELRRLLEGAGFRQTKIEPAAITARFPEPDRFLDLTIQGAAAVLPEFNKINEATRAELIGAIRRDVDEVLRAYTEADVLVLPMHAHIAIATA